MRLSRLCLLSACAIVLSVGYVSAQTLDFWPMLPGVNPVIDGQVTFPAEWMNAHSVVNDQGVGTYHAEHQQNWQAVSSSHNTNTYAGTTAFILHDLWGFTTSELADYNTFDFSLTNGSERVQAWIFANGDDPNDAAWIGNSGLGYANVDDRGFIVRRNGDPTTDRHWLPGDLEPGDAGWVWTNYYGFFGWAGFNDSAFSKGIPLSVNGQPNEVYELALYGGTTNAPGGPLGPFTPCQTTITVNISDPKNGSPSLPQQQMISGPAHFNIIPEPESAKLIMMPLLLIGWCALRCGRKKFSNSTVASG